ncbi:MAG TPA: 2OG-Fe(II) oxygenase family protein [Steroidobacteraceae bacterium]|nr:2OG-Fe(II) oxygenase family protein [Steroidobacteraceae bacterium]HRX90837.1 2OG-Fe(II) oxygenase family protein [Steroidobacteraceae bacterium]
MTRAVPELAIGDHARSDTLPEPAFSTAVTTGLQEYGFIVLSDHGIAPALLDAAYLQCQRLFALDTLVKNRYCGGLRGYTPFGMEHAKDSRHADLKEFWQIGRERPPDSHGAGQANLWPDELPEFQAVFVELFGALDAIARLVLRALTPALAVPPDYFESIACEGNSILRLIHYPPVPTNADPQALRSAPHEDINLLTVLVAARGAGLELRDRDGSWLPVATEQRNLIVDSGDMLARLTNDVIPATTHRVVNPVGPNVSRYSMRFFLHPTDATELDCLPSCLGVGPKYPPITAGEFLAQRVREIGLASDDTDAAEPS